MSSDRPDPEELLQRVQVQEFQAAHGKLKIYLGAAPGVGKTYTMLQDAQEKLKQGLDVVVGVVESHGRKEIEALLQNFEILPRADIDYRGKVYKEFDLDAALKRNPGLILIDEMAHTNVPGLRHEKRWQDIKEILDRGMDVYTTLNVQHIESLNDIIKQIVGISVKETVPDSMLEMAETIEVVDLPPDDLLKRLQEGKVYFPQQAELAKDSFFRKGNLIALRELALRITAERVGTEVLLYRQDQGIKRVWPTREKILVCVGHSTESTKLIRAARRMAANSQADWIAVHVDAPKLRLSEEDRVRAIQNLSLAERLGAETRILTGFDVIKEIMTFAREKNITQIVVGKEVRTRWKNLFYLNLADEIVRNSGEIDVYIITSDKPHAKQVKSVTSQRNTPWKTYGFAIGIVAIITLFNFIIHPYMYDTNLIMTYMFGIVLVALFGQAGPATLASTLSVLAYDFFFIPPFYSLAVSDLQYFFTLVVMFVVTQMISNLTILTRRQANAARIAEKRAGALYTLSHQLASIRGLDKLLDIATRYIAEMFNSEVVILFPEEKFIVAHSNGEKNITLNEKEQAVARWVYDLGQNAGLGTNTLPSSDALYIPLLASKDTIGVMRILPRHSRQLFTPEQLHLLEACAKQIALSIEVDRLQDQRKESELEFETERVRNSLLQSISHDLRVSLIVVVEAVSVLMDERQELDAKAVKKLADSIYLESEQLSRLINNLLQIAHLETASVELHKDYYSMSDIIDFVIKISSKKIGKKKIHLNVPPDLPQILLDDTMIQEVLINLIDNAIKFSPTDTPIIISALIITDKIKVSVEDKGVGIAPDDINRLFDKFYRGRMGTPQRGVGLGLTICRIVIEAHGGEIWAENCQDAGAVFHFTLPINE